MSIISNVKNLGLPLDKIIVIGGGLMDALGIRSAADVDLAVETSVFESLKSDPTWKLEYMHGLERLVRDDVEVWRGWEDARGVVSYQQLFDDSIVIDGVRFVSLDYLQAWKQWRNRSKDEQDLRLIGQYLRSQNV